MLRCSLTTIVARGIRVHPRSCDADMWLDNTLFCNALEPLLRLTGRDRDQCCDLSGHDDEPEVHGFTRSPFLR